MTCIVGLIDKNDILIGADSAGVSGYNLSIRTDEKVFIRDHMIIGFTSSFRMGQLLRYNLNIPEYSHGIDIFEWMVTKFIPAIRECLKSGGYSEIDKNVECGGYFLIGFKKRLFEISSDFQVGEVKENYNAMGSGKEIALGALYACSKNIKAEDKIMIALSAAEKFITSVSSPFKILRLKS
jgi:ATP-dependent protease HslVU (ClpYQ) peptidase subunit